MSYYIFYINIHYFNLVQWMIIEIISLRSQRNALATCATTGMIRRRGDSNPTNGQFCRLLLYQFSYIVITEMERLEPSRQLTPATVFQTGCDTITHIHLQK